MIYNVGRTIMQNASAPNLKKKSLMWCHKLNKIKTKN